MDLLNKRFKKAVLKFYDTEKRFDYEYCQYKCTQLFEDINFTYKYIKWDYHCKIGYHCNCIIKSRSYANLRRKYTDSGIHKDKEVFLYMKDIISTDMFIEWCFYMSMRERTNFYYANHNKELGEVSDDRSTPVRPSTPLMIEF